MENENTTFNLGNDRFFRVAEWKSEIRFDLRQFEKRNDKLFPTKKGISMPLQAFKTLMMEIESVDAALQNRQSFKSHLGANMYCTVDEDSVCVSIRQFWKTPENEVVATRRGLTLRPSEYQIFRSSLEKMEDLVPELLQTVPCVLTHDNQEGMIQCAQCNPNGLL